MASDMNPDGVLRIFLPHHSLECQSGILLGWQDVGQRFCCVTAILHGPLVKQTINTWLNSVRSVDRLLVLGTWQNGHPGPSEGMTQVEDVSSTLSTHWIQLVNNENELPRCLLQGCWLDSAIPAVTIILFDCERLASSCVLMNKAYKAAYEHRVVGTRNLASAAKTNVDFVTKAIMMHQTFMKDRRIVAKEFDYTNFASKGRTLLSRWWRKLMELIYMMVLVIVVFVESLSTARILSGKVARVIGNIPSVLCQIRQRHLQFKEAIDLWDTTPVNHLRFCNTLCVHMVDVALGVAVMFWLAQSHFTDQLATSLMDWADNVAAELQRLLHWLMGAPAGLKLNSHLDQFLGRFFIYHIYLWTGYLKFLRPVLGQALWYTSLMGCMGLSVQLALVQDLLSMLTLHIYCFYVYAARLYSLMVYALLSLFRLFRGKKWNPLRKRVDSAFYDVDQLFIGTLMFTILLFLLPTIALYYVVFTGLRLIVLTLQGLMYQLVDILNKIPVYTLLLKLTNSHTIGGATRFLVLEHCFDAPLFLSMQVLPMSWSMILKKYANHTLHRDTYTWATFGKRILMGHLVYPWMEPKQEGDR